MPFFLALYLHECTHAAMHQLSLSLIALQLTKGSQNLSLLWSYFNNYTAASTQARGWVFISTYHDRRSLEEQPTRGISHHLCRRSSSCCLFVCLPLLLKLPPPSSFHVIRQSTLFPSFSFLPTSSLLTLQLSGKGENEMQTHDEKQAHRWSHKHTHVMISFFAI